MGLYVQYGCGLSSPPGWLNFDASPRLRLENTPPFSWWAKASHRRLFPVNVRFGDITRGLPVSDQSCAGVYCSHVLEHIDRTQVVIALANTYAILRPGGVFRLVVPDLAWRARQYLVEHQSATVNAADRFMRSTYLGEEYHVSGLIGRARVALGNSAHRWMYDEAQMADLLDRTGFVDIRRCEFGDASDRMFGQVEDLGRFCEGGNYELAMEAKRPLA